MTESVSPNTSLFLNCLPKNQLPVSWRVSEKTKIKTVQILNLKSGALAKHETIYNSVIISEAQKEALF